MVLGDDAVSAAFRFLNANKDALKLGNGNRVFKYERPQTFDGGCYIVVNFLPFVYSDVICEGTVNINVHVPKTATNEPNGKRLSKMSRQIAEWFREGLYLDGAYYELYSDSRPTPDNDDTYYVNIKLNVTYNNLKQ